MTALELARFALYADLGLACGGPAAALLTRADLSPARPLIRAAVLMGLPLTLFAFLLSVAEMAGSGLAELDWQLAGEVVTGTAIGWAFLARAAATGLASGLCLAAPNRCGWQLTASAAALASLAWAGHAAAGEGPWAVAQLAADSVHLLAASVWIGALILFLGALRPAQAGAPGGAAPLERFARVGSLLVALLILTGIANLWAIAPGNAWQDPLASLYGKLLACKLGLFLAMLGLAAANRLLLVPALAQPGHTRQPRLRLRFSIGLELAAAVAILAIISRLGLLDPAGG